MPQSPRSARRQKIEPLSWKEAANAPALKGMTSLLDLSAEDVRNGTFDSFGPRAVQRIRIDSYPGDETTPVPFSSLPITARISDLNVLTPISAKQAGRAMLRDVSAPASLATPDHEVIPGYVSSPGSKISRSNARISELIASDTVTPGRGRSKVRKCVLAQDGHSLGEEAIYQIMWRSGRAENSDPNGSRTIRIGAADLGCKVNMAKKNVRQNIARLFEKLAVEILEDFETMSSQARLYRVYSYKQILERRRAAGLEYVLRNKGVVFCTRNGEQIVSSPAYVSSPGDETLRPAPPKKRRTRLSILESSAVTGLPAVIAAEGSEETDLDIVAQALNRYWPVDQAAAVQLLRACHRVCEDARAEEIAFFVREKLELARQNKKITNPTGLILATVPQSFVGSGFQEFRTRMERQRALAAEEQQRKLREQTEMEAWVIRERGRLETIFGDSNQSEADRFAAERRLRELASWDS
jgi:hypothetical protein